MVGGIGLTYGGFIKRDIPSWDGVLEVTSALVIWRIVTDEESERRRYDEHQRRDDAKATLEAVLMEMREVMLGYANYNKGLTGGVLPPPQVMHQLWKYRDILDPTIMKLIETAYIKYTRHTRGQNEELFEALHEAIDRTEEHLQNGVPGRLTTSALDKVRNQAGNL